MKKILPILVVVSLVLCSCKYTYTYRESSARFAEPQRAAFITPVTADMQISSEKVTFTAEFDNTISKIAVAQANAGNTPSVIVKMKDEALAMALAQYQADDIVAPTFNVTTNDDATKIIITITGYPAKYVNFRKATKEDVELMHLLNTSDK